MKSRLASVRAAGGLERVNRAVQLLEDEWQRHGEVRLEQFWERERTRDPVDPVEGVTLLSELVKADMRSRFARGETPTVLEYLDRFPELRTADSRVLSLVYEEYCLNEECGKAPDVESFCNRYADWKSSLISQLQYHRLFSQAAGVRPSLPRFPEAGQDFEEFRLQSLLGAGGMSRVFLARDLSLGGKQVVLKVTLDRGQEPKVQGPLDHPHIVPVNSVAYQTDGSLCGLSMPYRPGLTLDEVIPLVDPASRPRKALAVWEALVRGTRDAARPVADGELEPGPDVDRNFKCPRGDGWEDFPIRGSYPQGVAWLVMILARALHYAHRRRTFHRDVKPGNLLLTLQNGPQLLDFNLAESPHSANQAQSALHGGTLPYMAPEQIEAFINPQLWGNVGARADVYSLGLVLRELLTGQKPELPAAGLPPARALRAVLDRRPFVDTNVRRSNPAIPASLESIVVKCLALSPDDRYPDAQTLEQDLDRFLKHLPLRQSANPSCRERVGNWVFRKRRVFYACAGTIVLAVALLGLSRTRPSNVPHRVEVESSPTFLQAVTNISNGNFGPAIDDLTYLDQRKVQSSLVKFYLSLAHDEVATQQEDSVKHAKQHDADRFLRMALAAEDAKDALLNWSPTHPEVVKYLVDFADSRIHRADVIGQTFDTGKLDDDDRRDREFRNPSYEVAKDALVFAEQLDPTSPRIQRLLARAERMFKEYESSYQRISRLIQSIDAGAMVDDDDKYSCWNLRARVAFLWAERDLREGGIVNEAAPLRLKEAVRDLDRCDMYLHARQFEDQDLKIYHVLHDRVRTMATSAEVDLKVSKTGSAERYIRKAEDVLAQLNDCIKLRKLEVHVPPTTDLQDRLKVLKNELKLASRAPARRDGAKGNASSGPSVANVAGRGA